MGIYPELLQSITDKPLIDDTKPESKDGTIPSVQQRKYPKDLHFLPVQLLITFLIISEFRNPYSSTTECIDRA